MTSDRWRLRTRRAALRLSRTVSARRASSALAPSWQRAWVRAARWRAALTWRLPPRLRRWMPLWALETGIGALPLWRGEGAGVREGGGAPGPPRGRAGGGPPAPQ